MSFDAPLLTPNYLAQTQQSCHQGPFRSETVENGCRRTCRSGSDIRDRLMRHGKWRNPVGSGFVAELLTFATGSDFNGFSAAPAKWPLVTRLLGLGRLAASSCFCPGSCAKPVSSTAHRCNLVSIPLGLALQVAPSALRFDARGASSHDFGQTVSWLRLDAGAGNHRRSCSQTERLPPRIS
jgi:hypothetical protein